MMSMGSQGIKLLSLCIFHIFQWETFSGSLSFTILSSSFHTKRLSWVRNFLGITLSFTIFPWSLLNKQHTTCVFDRPDSNRTKWLFSFIRAYFTKSCSYLLKVPESFLLSCNSLQNHNSHVGLPNLVCCLQHVYWSHLPWEQQLFLQTC